MQEIGADALTEELSRVDAGLTPGALMQQRAGAGAQQQNPGNPAQTKRQLSRSWIAAVYFCGRTGRFSPDLLPSV
jgi:hypothetical protein